MIEMTIEQAVWLRDLFLKPLEIESATTARVLQAVPVSAGEYRPDPASRTALDLLRHIAAADLRFVDAVVLGEFNTQNVIPETANTPVEIAEWYAGQHAARRAALAGVDGAALLKPVNFRGMFTRPAVTYLQMGLHHTIHHRGQLSAYLRSMGAKVPSIYGESYDAAQARLAAGK
ncbi:MAG TPA: DinB family protein [Vicinamibacterales bacterium]|nr:DinB family protein [Vicinamibacterales bacterium]